LNKHPPTSYGTSETAILTAGFFGSQGIRLRARLVRGAPLICESLGAAARYSLIAPITELKLIAIRALRPFRRPPRLPAGKSAQIGLVLKTGRTQLLKIGRTQRSQAACQIHHQGYFETR